jgi:hypothetical protein
MEDLVGAADDGPEDPAERHKQRFRAKLDAAANDQRPAGGRGPARTGATATMAILNEPARPSSSGIAQVSRSADGFR